MDIDGQYTIVQYSTENYVVFHWGKDTYKKNRVVPIVKRDVAQAVRGYNA